MTYTFLPVTDKVYNKNKSPLETDLNPATDNFENNKYDNNWRTRLKLPIPELLNDYKNIISKVFLTLNTLPKKRSSKSLHTKTLGLV